MWTRFSPSETATRLKNTVKQTAKRGMARVCNRMASVSLGETITDTFSKSRQYMANAKQAVPVSLWQKNARQWLDKLPDRPKLPSLSRLSTLPTLPSLPSLPGFIPRLGWRNYLKALTFATLVTTGMDGAKNTVAVPVSWPDRLLEQSDLGFAKYNLKDDKTIWDFSRRFNQTAQETLMENNLNGADLRKLSSDQPLFLLDAQAYPTRWEDGLGTVGDIVKAMGIPEHKQTQYIRDIGTFNQLSDVNTIFPGQAISLPVKVLPKADSTEATTPYLEKLAWHHYLPETYKLVPMYNVSGHQSWAETMLEDDRRIGQVTLVERPNGKRFWRYISGKVSEADKQAFYLNMREAAKAAGVLYPDAVAALACHESRYGTRQIGQYNPFNVKHTQKSKGTGSPSMMVWEVENGVDVKRPARFQNYANYGQAAEYVDKRFFRKIKRTYHTKSDDAAIWRLREVKYATDPKHETGVYRIWKKYHTLP